MLFSEAIFLYKIPVACIKHKGHLSLSTWLKSCNSTDGTIHHSFHFIKIECIDCVSDLVVMRVSHKRRIIDHQSRITKSPITSLVRKAGKLAANAGGKEINCTTISAFCRICLCTFLLKAAYFSIPTTIIKLPV